MAVKLGRIDVHHHVIPPAFVDAMSKQGITKVAGAPLPTWSPEKSIKVMDANGIQTAITSLSAPGVFLDCEKQAITLARACNDFSAGMKAKFPGRFGFFAVLPMPLTEASCKEAIYALDYMGADGVVLLGSTRGIFLGDPSLEELMQELNRRAAVVFVHPNLHETSESLNSNLPGFLMEFLCDTTRAAANLILQGVTQRFPEIRWILSHSGGFLPYIAHRLSMADNLEEYQANIPLGALHYVRQFYYDTALSPSRFSQVALKALVPPNHILFGSDFPFAPAAITRVQCNTLKNADLWDAGIQYGINRGHALDLFPDYQLADEHVTADPIFVNESIRAQLSRGMAAFTASMAESFRNK